MKCWRLNGKFDIGALTMEECATPALNPYEVRIKVKAVSLNYRDLMIVKGQYSKSLPFPLIPCSDGAGEVVEVGDSVRQVKIGDRVVANVAQKWIAGASNEEIARSMLGGAINGMLAEYVTLPETALVKIPEHLSFEEGATLPCAALTAWNALVFTGKVKAGETVLTMGTGGVSLFAVQFAQISGARVILTSGSDHKIQRVKKVLGVTDTINYKVRTDWEKAALEMTGGRGVDHVIELGGAGTLSRSCKAVRTGGRISLIGVLAGNESQFNPVPVVMKNICLQGIFVGSKEIFEQMNTAISLHKLKPVIDKCFDFQDAQNALSYMESQAHFGKIVIRV